MAIGNFVVGGDGDIMPLVCESCIPGFQPAQARQPAGCRRYGRLVVRKELQKSQGEGMRDESKSQPS